MSETKEETPVRIGADRAKKISLATFGGGRKPSDEEQEQGGAFIGTLRGKATGVRTIESADPKTGEMVAYTSIVGRFQAVNANRSKPIVESATLYLPSGFHESLCDALAPEDPVSGERKPNGNEVDFVFDVRCIKAENKSGFAYMLAPIFERSKHATNDLFAELDKAEQAHRLEREKAAKALAHDRKGGQKAA